MMIPGSPEAPMTEEEIVGKFKGCWSFGLNIPEAEAATFAEMILGIDRLEDVSQIAQAFPAPRH